MKSDLFLSHLCVSSLIWRNRPIDDAACLMMRLGLVHLELAAAPLAPLHYQTEGNNSRLFNLLAEAGVRVAVLRLTGMTYEEKLRAIADAGARRIPAVLDRAEHLSYPDLIDRTRIYAQCAAQAGVHLILENDFYSSCDNAEAQLGLARDIRHPALGFAFAPPHAVADDRDPGDEVMTLGPALRLAYLWDAPVTMKVGKFREEFDPGPPEAQTPGSDQGQVDWGGYFEALSSVNFRGIFNLKWLGGEHWLPFQIEEAILESISFCSQTAKAAGFGR